MAPADQILRAEGSMKRKPGLTEPTAFEIYQTEAGYVAVTNDVRRKILAALAKKDRELTDLVGITGKAKPTLSNLHMRELLAQKLIEETPHPTDQRKKIYRLVGVRIGSSNIPIEQLRGAVKQYVAASPLAHAIPLQQVLDVLLAAHPESGGCVSRQGRRLGEIISGVFRTSELRDLVTQVASYWEREGITRTTKIDLEHLAVEVELNPRYLQNPSEAKLVVHLLAGFFEGLLGRAGSEVRAITQTEGDRVRVGVVG